jgi:lipopolysaccharide export system permease protein
VLVFFSITSLIIPGLMLVLAPIAMLMAVLHTLVRLNNDSELVVMSAAGISPGRLFRPFLALLRRSRSSWCSSAPTLPRLQRELVSSSLSESGSGGNIVRPGTFTSIEKASPSTSGETQRQPVQRHPDRRFAQRQRADDGDRERNIVRAGGPFRHERWLGAAPARGRDFGPVERYAFDLSPIRSRRAFPRLREKYLWELVAPAEEDPLIKAAGAQFSVEMHDRLVAPLYTLALVVIAFVVLCIPRTTRQ